MNRRNYQKELDRILDRTAAASSADGALPRLLLHACCAPCSSYVLEYLSGYFEITVFFFNPNMDSPEEYARRASEEKRLIAEMPLKHKVDYLEGAYRPETFYGAVRGLEKEPEGGARCGKCFELRLSETARQARQGGYDYFTTSLTISPLKNADVLNAIGERLGEEYGVAYLTSDFKKRDGYKRSIELSKQYGLYRQNYCGCVFSRQDKAVLSGTERSV